MTWCKEKKKEGIQSRTLRDTSSEATRFGQSYPVQAVLGVGCGQGPADLLVHRVKRC